MSQRSRNGRHRRRSRFVTVPSVVGSVTVLAATSGALTMPSASGAPTEPVALDAAPTRPQPARSDTTGALDTVAAAGQVLSEQTSRAAKAGHEKIVTEQREAAAAAAARAEREAKKWVLPLTDYRITAGFGSSGRMWAGTHTGLDFAAPTGTEVRAISAGTIVFAGYDGSYGNKIEIRHWDGTVSWYGHLSRFVLREGAEVTPGDLIGRVGSTGNSTGPHVHLEIHPDGGSAVNPRPWLADHGLDV